MDSGDDIPAPVQETKSNMAQQVKEWDHQTICNHHSIPERHNCANAVLE